MTSETVDVAGGSGNGMNVPDPPARPPPGGHPRRGISFGKRMTSNLLKVDREGRMKGSHGTLEGAREMEQKYRGEQKLRPKNACGRTDNFDNMGHWSWCHTRTLRGLDVQ